MEDIVKVNEYNNLKRDLRSNSIVNTDHDAYLKHKFRKTVAAKQREELDLLKKSIQELNEKYEKLEMELAVIKGINIQKHGHNII